MLPPVQTRFSRLSPRERELFGSMHPTRAEQELRLGTLLGVAPRNPDKPEPSKNRPKDRPSKRDRDLAKAHEKFEERSLIDVTADRLKKGGANASASFDMLTGAYDLDIAQIFDRADELEARGAGVEDFAKLAGQHSRVNLNTLLDPKARTRSRQSFISLLKMAFGQT